MKICVISFDFWNYDEHIVEELKNLGKSLRLDRVYIFIISQRDNNLLYGYEWSDDG